MSRIGEAERQTLETQIKVRLNLDGRGQWAGSSGIGFLDHLLAQVARHGLLDLELGAKGDLQVDNHHTVEDIGLTLGQALRQAVGAKKGIARYSSAWVPMDEALVLVVLDLSGRPFLDFQVDFAAAKIGGLETEMLPEFLRALATEGGITLHVRQFAGRNSHHVAEAIFKALGQALRRAVSLDPRLEDVLSTKGTLV
ncbi:MAG: imidazoleglycerol-phosphate dehydratase HisB [Clostridia bacterium]|nr:MAG: imidazoleglycerol-phosphate dehydratase HisB [Clostridia bacterium]